MAGIRVLAVVIKSDRKGREVGKGLEVVGLVEIVGKGWELVESS